MNPLAPFGEPFWSAMLAHLWQTTLVILVLAALAGLLRRAPARITSALWWAAVAKLFLPLPLLAPWSRAMAQAWMPAAAADAGAVRAATWYYPEILRVTASGEALARPSAVTLLTLAWLSGILVILLRWGLRAPRSVDWPDACVPASARRRIGAALHDTAVPGRAIRLSPAGRMPSVVGLFRPRIIVPVRLVQGLVSEELRAIVLHEEAHRRRKDPLRTLLLGIVTTIFFFYPPIWWLVRRIRDTTEMACDDAVLDAGVSPELYSRALARTLRLGLAPADVVEAIHGRSSSSLVRRFERLESKRRFVAMPRHRLALTAALSIVLVGSFVPLVGPNLIAGNPQPEPRSVEPRPEPSMDYLERLSGARTEVGPMTGEYPAGDLLRQLGKIGGFDVKIEGMFEDKIVTLGPADRTVGEVLVLIAQRIHGLRFEAPEPDVLVASGVLLAGVGPVTNPRLIPEFKVEPTYPENMRANGVGGTVILQALIDESGYVTELELLNATPDDYPSMAESAMDAIRQWRYEPATSNGKPVRVYFTVMVQFRLDNDGKGGDEEPV